MSKKILIVEDEYITALDLKIQLMLLGHHDFEIIPNGEKAIVRAAKKSFDLILMDIKLNGEMDGIEAAQKIKQKSNVPIVFVSGNTDLLQSDRIKTMDPDGILPKPIREYELKAIIEKIFK